MVLICACDPDDDSPVVTDNFVKVSVDGQSYYQYANNVFSLIDLDVNSDGESFYNVLLFASGIGDENEDFSFSGNLTSVTNPAELRPGLNSVRFTQVGNDCSGTLFTSTDLSTVNIASASGRATGKIEGRFSSVFGGCQTDFKIEFSNIKVGN